MSMVTCGICKKSFKFDYTKGDVEDEDGMPVCRDCVKNFENGKIESDK